MASWCARCWRDASLLHLRLPQPAQRFRQDGPAVLAVVPAIAHDEAVLVALVAQRRLHLEVAQRPGAMFVVQVVLAVLEEDADRLLLRLADDPRVGVAAADVGETADVTEH